MIDYHIAECNTGSRCCTYQTEVVTNWIRGRYYSNELDIVFFFVKLFSAFKSELCVSYIHFLHDNVTKLSHLLMKEAIIQANSPGCLNSWSTWGKYHWSVLDKKISHYWHHLRHHNMVLISLKLETSPMRDNYLISRQNMYVSGRLI